MLISIVSRGCTERARINKRKWRGNLLGVFAIQELTHSLCNDEDSDGINNESIFVRPTSISVYRVRRDETPSSSGVGRRPRSRLSPYVRRAVIKMTDRTSRRPRARRKSRFYLCGSENFAGYLIIVSTRVTQRTRNNEFKNVTR